jgi:Ni,Fe-hydrogenase III large subunit/Ni,Fe-hydrogenase III component G
MSSITTNVATARVSVSITDLGEHIAAHVRSGWRLGHLTARQFRQDKGNAIALITIMLAPTHIEVWESEVPKSQSSFSSMTNEIPGVHWFERFIYDLFGLMPDGHPRFKSVIFHASWPDDYFPLAGDPDVKPTASDRKRDFGFVPVTGDGVFEIAVGPIHAGIIEPGHFRFSCLGEEIHNLDIRLGYLHRGIEKRLESCPLAKARFLAESASSDTTVANAIAHARAVEALTGTTPADPVLDIRVVALELERSVVHISDLGGICADMGFLAGSSIFARLRGKLLGVSERLTGTRFMTSFVIPGGVSRVISNDIYAQMIVELDAVLSGYNSIAQQLLDNFGAMERMEGIGVVPHLLAADLGLVGPAGRASGIRYDVRQWRNEEAYVNSDWSPVFEEDGDIFARIRVRAYEVTQSLQLIRRLIGHLRKVSQLPNTVIRSLPANKVGVGIVEAFRGELIHTIFTGSDGRITRYAIKDPSTNNWPALAHAVRGELISDFPLCNKSFGLSYSGNDL